MNVFGDRAFREVIRLNEIIKVGPNPKGLVSLKEGETPEISLSLHVCTGKRPCDDTARRWLSPSQEERPHQNQPSDLYTLMMIIPGFLHSGQC